jgi:hypothetical protein
MSDINQIVIFKGNDMFFCNNKILETIQNSEIFDKTQSKYNPAFNLCGIRLIKVSKKRMKELLELSNKHNVSNIQGN